MFIPLKIIGSGKAVPEQKVYSSKLDKVLEKESGYVRKRSGIVYRYFADLEQTQANLASLAIKDACLNAGLDIKNPEIDLLINVNAVPQQALPSTGAHILAELEWGYPNNNIASYDMNASCLGFIPALQHAGALLSLGLYKRIAISACDMPSRGLNWEDEESSYIFGDGAACVIVEHSKSQEHGISAFLMRNYPKALKDCAIKAGGSQVNPTTGCNPLDFTFKMNGFSVFKETAKVLPDFLNELFAIHNSRKKVEPIELKDVDYWVIHQASHLAMQHMTERLGIPKNKLMNIYQHHGNQVSASLPTALHETIASGKWEVGSGNKIALVGTGAGLTIGGIIWQL